jgi:DNA (cytosine-5)-methyltransferase 1
MIRLVPHDGGGRRSLPRRLWLPCHKRLTEKRMEGAGTVYGRMRWDAPSPTITTRCNTPSCGRFVHPTQDRAITLREAARLQSIPDDYRISGSKERTAMWIGNAMPVDLAEAMGHQALRYV